MALPYTFADRSGRVPASYLDADFSYLNGLIEAVEEVADAAATTLATLSALRQYTGAATSALVKCRTTAGDRGGGVWTFRTGDQSSNVTNDPQGGIWAAPDSAPTGASGAWQRQFDGPLVASWFGAKGDNAAIDTTPVNGAITCANAQTFPINIYFLPGQYLIDAALNPIRKGVRLFSDGPRSAILVFSGNYDCITLAGANGARCADSGLYNIGMYCDGMTGGNAIVVNWAQDIVISNVLLVNAFNPIYIRQAGNTQITYCDIQPIRGTYGIKAYGDGTTQNGEVDKVDVVLLTGTTLQNAPTPSVTDSTADLVWLDGYVQTVDVSALRLLCGKRGMRITNTPGVAYPLWPSFINGMNLQVENSYLENVRGDYVNGLNITGGFFVGSQTENGLYFGPNASKINIGLSEIRGNFLHGAQFDGSSDVNSVANNVYKNSQTGSTTKSGIYLGPTSVTGFKSVAGNSGKLAAAGVYTENQKNGIEVAAATKAVSDATDLSGNATAPYSGTLAVIEDGVSVGALFTAASTLGFLGRSGMTAPSDGVLALFNAAQTGFLRLLFGGTSASFPALKRVNASLATVLANDSDYADHLAQFFQTMTALITATNGGSTAAFTANMIGATSGPATAAQHGWVRMKDNAGGLIWVPVWK